MFKIFPITLSTTEVEQGAGDLFLHCRLLGDICLTIGVLDEFLGFIPFLAFFARKRRLFKNEAEQEIEDEDQDDE